MRIIDTLRHRLRSLVHRSSEESELDDELRFHLEREIDEQVARGIPREQAERLSRRALGSAPVVKEYVRDSWGWAPLDRLVSDLRFALRLLRRQPGFSVIAVLTLTLGIGASVTIFGVVDAVLLRPLPFPEANRLVRLWEGKVGQAPSRNVVNGWNFLDWQARSHSFEAMAAIDRGNMDLTGEGEPVSVPGARVTTAYFPILRVQPFLGRWFFEEEGRPGKDDRVIIAYGLWQTRFGGDRGVLGRRIQVNGTPATIVGVMPPGFTFVTSRIDIWAPIAIERSKDWGGRFLTTVGRLKPGVTIDAASRELDMIAAQIAAERPDYNKGWTVEIVPVLDDLVEGIRLPLYVLLGSVGFLLLIACANVANLLLMRGAERTREIAVRAALGAGRARILRQLVTESLLLAALACGAGLLLAQFGLRAVPRLLASSDVLPRLDTIHLDTRVFLFAVVVSGLTAVLFGLFPAARLARVELHDALKRGSRGSAGGHRRFRQVFVTAQVALALVLLVGAGLLGRSFARLVAVDPGFKTEHLLTMDLFTSPAKFGEPAKRADYLARIIAEIAAVPGVSAASSVHMLPLEERVSGSCYGRFGEEQPTAAGSKGADMLVAGPGYLRTMGIPLVSGREFSATDRIGSPSAVMVTQSFASEVFPGQNAIGKQLNICWSIKNPVEIVGVTNDIRQKDLAKAPRATIFLPATQTPPYFTGLVVRTSGDPAAQTRSVEAAIQRVNPDQAVFDVRTMDEVFARSVAQPRFESMLLLGFAAVALSLAAIGVYGVVAYSVTQRTREIGIRVVLGATRRRVAGLVLREGLVLAALGVGIGLAGALGLSRVMQGMLFAIRPNDPATLAFVSAMLVLVVVFAVLIPARRAAVIAPVAALREE
jgi:putative ABC transport system permease protein